MNKARHGLDWLAQRPYIIAIAISLVLILWMASGIAQEKTMPSEKGKSKQVIPKVQVETMQAQTVRDAVELYGRTEPDRIATLKAEVYGKVEQVFAKRGAKVKKDQLILKLALNDLPSQLAQSKALLKQREIEYQGAKKLNADGYQGEVQLSTAAANLEAVKAEIKRLEIAIDNTSIRAPFDGVLNTRYVEVGDYLQIGDDVAVVADLDPLVIRAFVTENQVGKLSVGQTASVRLLNQQPIQGQLRYIASLADENTNTFKIEATIDNPDYQLLAGISGELELGFEQVPAIKVSPALLALDSKGNIGVKSVHKGTVVFTPINVVKSESDGMWLTGFGDQAEIITLGQGFVREGDRVEAVKVTR